ncbi:LPXTG cell wall anchor domain-containing protein, partial [Staphylococcus microti]
EVTKDGLVTPAEKAAVDAANAKIEAAKKAAQTALDDIPAGIEGKVELQERLDNVNPVASPEINDANANGISDENDAKLKLADDLVKAAEKAEKEAEDKLAEVMKDGLVTPAEKALIDKANAKVDAAKKAAQTALDDIPAGIEGRVGLQERLDKVHAVPSPEVNDANSNGIDDVVEAGLQGGSTGNTGSVIGSNNGGVVSTQQNPTMTATQDQNTATDSNQVATKTLPETGNTSTNTTLFGSLFAALGGLFLLGRRRKEKDAK